MDAESQLPSEQKTWGAVAHLSSLSGYITFLGFVLGPLLVWLIQRDKMQFVDDQGREALNFNISVGIYLIACIMLGFTIVGLVIAVPAFALLIVGHLVLTVVAAIRAGDGEAFRYPLTLRLIR